jgi:PIN domain nuclease of toxin-antitoxin system
MRLLLDTHAFLWFVTANGRLSGAARAVIEDESNDSYVSAASTWEIAIKSSLGKLQLTEPYPVLVPREIDENGFIYLGIELTHTARVAELAFHHHDPFDRLLVAQALEEQLAVVSADAALDAYGVRRIW